MKIETGPAGPRIVAEEDFTACHAAGQRDLLAQCLETTPTVFPVDMGAVTAIDGRGLALLFGLAASCRRRGIPLQLEAVRPDLRQMLDLCQLPGQAGISGAATDD